MVIVTKRWLVVFRSHAAPPADVTAVAVRAGFPLAAIAAARREAPPQHPWAIATVNPWPRGSRSVEDAARRAAAAAP